jgi:hypothetical protein
VGHANTFAPAETEAEPAPEATEASTVTEQVETDPTVAYAALTEIDSTGATAAFTNGHPKAAAVSGGLANTDVGDSAANATAESQWDTPTNDLSASITQEDWVKVPRDPAETETGVEATPAAPGPSQSWADDQPEHTEVCPGPLVSQMEKHVY